MFKFVHKLVCKRFDVSVRVRTHKIGQKIDSTNLIYMSIISELGEKTHIKYNVGTEQTEIVPMMVIEYIECRSHPFVSRSP